MAEGGCSTPTLPVWGGRRGPSLRQFPPAEPTRQSTDAVRPSRGLRPEVVRSRNPTGLPSHCPATVTTSSVSGRPRRNQNVRAEPGANLPPRDLAVRRQVTARPSPSTRPDHPYSGLPGTRITETDIAQSVSRNISVSKRPKFN